MQGCVLDVLVPSHRHHDTRKDSALLGRPALLGAPHPARPATRGGNPASGRCPAVPTEYLWRHLQQVGPVTQLTQYRATPFLSGPMYLLQTTSLMTQLIPRVERA